MQNSKKTNGEEKTLFQDLIQRNCSVILLIDPVTGKIVDANEAATNFYGYKNLGSMNIKTLNQLPDDKINTYLNAAAKEEKNRFEFKHKLANGAVKDVEVHSTPITFRNKKLLFSIVHDITGKNAAEQFSKILSESTFELLELKTPAGIYKYTCDKLYELLKESAIVSIVEYDNPNNTWKMMEVRGIGSLLEKTLKMLGVNLREMQGEIKTEYLLHLQKGKMASLEFDLHRLTKGKYSQKTADALKKILPVKELLVMPFRKGENIYGNVSIIVTQNTPDFNRRLIEAFISQAATILEKIKIEVELLGSEQKYRAIFENSHDSISVHPVTNNKFTGFPKVNSQTIQTFGYTRSEFKKLTIFDITPREEHKKIQVGLEQVFKKGKHSLETRHITKSGKIIPVEIKGYIFNVGNEKFLTVVTRNLEKQKKAEQDLIDSRNYYQALIENSTDVVSILDEKSTIIYESPSHKHILGYDTNELIGDSGFSYIHPDDIEKVQKQFKKLLQNPGYTENLNLRFRHKNGKWLHLEGTAKNLLNNPSVGGIVINYRDATKRVEFEQKLIKSKEKAEENERLKTAFLANMSHEIRTPMNGILGFIDILNEPGLSKDDKETFLELVKKSGERLLNTINDIIEISKIEANQTYLNFSDENLEEILQEHLSFFQPEARQKGISLKLQKRPEHKLKIKTDKNKLDSILINLIKNAIKFTKEGEIEFGCIPQNKQLQFFVKDTGIGIASDKIEAIFNRFEQAEMGINRGHEGTGLGLSISKAYAEMLGGNLWVESEIGKGSTFRFTIKHLPAADEEAIRKNDSEEQIESHPAGTILVAEDDTVSFSLVETYLAKENFKLLRAQNGEEAIRMVKENPDIDLVLMDVRMPVMDGYAATHEIKKINKNLPVIAQTAYALEGDQEKAIEAGCDDYISKPLKKNELIRKIKRILC
ncbi:MAG: PAS domain S-box protein [Tangfeifania sp.]